MAEESKFLLGRGDKLTKSVGFRSGFGPVKPVYEWGTQRLHLTSQLHNVVEHFSRLPDVACPMDQTVSIFDLHPQHYSRSAFPEILLRENNLRLIGSMPIISNPRSGRGSGNGGGASSTAMFIAGTRKSYERALRALERLQPDDALSAEWTKIESIAPQTVDQRIGGALPRGESAVEIVLHFDAQLDFRWEPQFRKFAEDAGIRIDQELQYQSRGLLFLAAEGDVKSVRRLANFSFVRSVRPMPKMRVIDTPYLRRVTRGSVPVKLPVEGPVDSDCRVVVFDGGLPHDHPFGKWARSFEPSSMERIGEPVAALQQHGLAVTSALLFGHVTSETLPQPYCAVDHYRVLGKAVYGRNMYATMLYIEKILSTSGGRYEFANFSIGPEEVVGNDKVTAWTAMLDDHCQQRDLLVAIAVGNDGLLPSPENRIQVPSDCVNAVAVGAATNETPSWKRAPYSCIGPGRAPGSIKPDLVQFGGDIGAEFGFVFPGQKIVHGCGTSYATPSFLRTAAGIRAHFGRGITVLGIRALMVHSAKSNGLPRHEVGWGMPPTDPADITICPDGSVRIIYDGTIDPSKVIRALVPLPNIPLTGFITIRATFCYRCQTDPHTPGDYTRAGLEIAFRPHRLKLPPPSPSGQPPDPDFPKTSSFFETGAKRTEQNLRRDALKWDTVRNAEHRFQAASLDQPVFDVHYVARQPGDKDSPSSAEKLAYALVVTVTADKHPDIYERVREQYPVLEVIRPKTPIPIRLRP